MDDLDLKMAEKLIYAEKWRKRRERLLEIINSSFRADADKPDASKNTMPSMKSLHLARHYLRRAHEDAARRYAQDPLNDELAHIASAYEEVCEMMGRHTLLAALCNLAQDDPGISAHVAYLGIAGAAIGLPHAIVFDLETPRLGSVKPERPGDDASVGQCN